MSSNSHPVLSKEEINAILDCPYETGYTYANSIAYKPLLGTKDYKHPRLCRPPCFTPTVNSFDVNCNEKPKKQNLCYCAFLLLFMVVLFFALFFAERLIQCQGVLKRDTINEGHTIIVTEMYFPFRENLTINTTYDERRYKEIYAPKHIYSYPMQQSPRNITALQIYRKQPTKKVKSQKNDKIACNSLQSNNITTTTMPLSSIYLHSMQQLLANHTALQIYRKHSSKATSSHHGNEMVLSQSNASITIFPLRSLDLNEGYCIVNKTETKRTYWLTMEIKFGSYNLWIPLKKMKWHRTQIRNQKLLFWFTFTVPVGFF